MTLSELMERYCDGDAEAFERIYALVAPTVFAELFALTGDRVQALAALEQTFLDLHACRSVYVLGADPLPWIRALAQAAVGHCRQRETAVAMAATWIRP